MPSLTQRFETDILPCLDAGYNLARWLLREDASAEDVLQDACLRALRHLDQRQGADARPWFLRIVRHCAYSHLQARAGHPLLLGLNEDELDAAQERWQQSQAEPDSHGALDPAQPLHERQCRDTVNAALRSLPPFLREVLVLRELEGLDYAEIALIAGLPMGTVMSRLSRARARMRQMLAPASAPDAPKGRTTP